MTERRALQLATFGEPKSLAQQNLVDWNAYLDEFAAEHNSFEYLVELFNGVFMHFAHRWTDENVSSVPMAFALVFIVLAIPVVTLGLEADVTFSFVADLHIFLAYLLIAVVAGRRRAIEFDPLLTFGFLLAGLGHFHEALTIDDHGNAPLIVPAMWVVGVATLSIAISSARHRMPLGRSQASRMLFHAGLLLHAVAYITVLSFNTPLQITTALIIVLMSIIPAITIDRVWVASQVNERVPTTVAS